MIYVGIGPEEGTVVEEEDAFRYAFERCTKGNLEDQKEFQKFLVEWFYKEFQKFLVEWFYSGNWVEEDR